MSSRKLGAALAAAASLLLLAAPGALATRNAVSINVSANPAVAGDPLVLWGRLTGPGNGGRIVRLWHRVTPAPTFTVVGQARTDAAGYYAFARADGVVTSNRNWYATALTARSRTIHEHVYAAVTLSGPAGANLLTGPGHPATFTGTVSPAQTGGAVLLQRQNAAAGGDDWRTIDRGRVAAGGTFSIVHRFVTPGDANLRVLVRRTVRNLPSPSNVLEYQISQAQNPALTIMASADPITFGQPVVISGILAGGPSQPVTLLAHTDGKSFAPVAQATTDAAGNYAFAPQIPVNSTFYAVRGAGRSSSVLFEGVGDALTVSASATSIPAGQTVACSGGVAPDKTGHVIYLQRRNPTGGDFHTVQVATVGAGSTYTIVHRVYAPGTKAFRVLIPGGPENQGAASAPITITVVPAPTASLPTAATGVTVGSTTG